MFCLNASSLQRLSLEGWTSNELQPSTLQQLSCLTNLRELTVQGGDQTPSMLQARPRPQCAKLELCCQPQICLDVLGPGY